MRNLPPLFLILLIAVAALASFSASARGVLCVATASHGAEKKFQRH